MNNKDAPLESVLTLAILTGLLSRIEDGVVASVSHRDLCLVPFAMPSPTAIMFLSYLTDTFSKSCHLSESSEGRQPSARTAYDDGSAWHPGGLIHPDLLLAGSPSRAGGGIPEPVGGHHLVDPPRARIVLHNNTANMDKGWENLRIFN